jgi:hypothetical protein
MVLIIGSGLDLACTPIVFCDVNFKLAIYEPSSQMLHLPAKIAFLDHHRIDTFVR